MASKQGQGPGQIEITSLPISQLQELKSQLDRELEHLNTSFQSLRIAQSKFRDCLKSISQGVNASTAEKPLLVPLTSSLYVPGKLSNPSTVLIDIGTGFFVEKSTADATDFYNRKVGDLAHSLKDLEQVINGKVNNVRLVEEVIRVKVLSAQQEGGQGAGGKDGPKKGS
ncbi:Prefoldin-domain-containing protein [Lindgomyces ingoldianus]|uniref:Prefoldin-domain-containing protein n=1 Tax=Lindgomyces ingoldianus TaxID=673940 RepID=A0ACB6R139_9PLEO|nr:Prefoldin-domain-containing protein [Lindgomyces ingoldianus]KAF2472161.1 Prefoldin-domain-containing protein [Lindgomyces ingoldianus]